MIIVCPNCRTRYQLAQETLGEAGREVQCARCNTAWLATRQQAEHDSMITGLAVGQETVPGPAHKPQPKPVDEEDTLFDPEAEAALDAQFEAEERKVAEEAPAPEPARKIKRIDKIDLALVRKRQQALKRRQRELARKMPPAHIRRRARTIVLSCLGVLVVGGIAFRTEIVTVLPSMAGLYAAVGLPVNVVGLDFSDVHTVRGQIEGKDTLQVNANIDSLSARPVNVPPVLVSLLDRRGHEVYAWTVMPQQRSISPDETISLHTELTAPPPNVHDVRLTFVAGGRVQDNHHSKKTAVSQGDS